MNTIRLLNAYGPTEATITATAFEVIPGLFHTPLLRESLLGGRLRTDRPTFSTNMATLSDWNSR